MASESSTNFAHLPPEIRLKIWRLAGEDDSDPRIIEVTSTLEKATPTSEELWEFKVLMSNPPNLLAVNRESRYELLGNYIAPFSPLATRLTPSLQEKNCSVADLLINPNNDVLYLHENHDRRRPKTFFSSTLR